MAKAVQPKNISSAVQPLKVCNSLVVADPCTAFQPISAGNASGSVDIEDVTSGNLVSKALKKFKLSPDDIRLQLPAVAKSSVHSLLDEN